MTENAYVKNQVERKDHWNRIAVQENHTMRCNGYYHRRLQEVYSFLIPPGRRIIDIGCGKGDLLAALKSSYGVGVDFSSDMILKAQQRHPELRFLDQDAHELNVHEKFDVVILSDLVNDLWDVQRVLENVYTVATPETRLILNMYSRIWELPLRCTEKLGLSTKRMEQNWLTIEDLSNLLHLADFEIVRTWQEFLCPIPLPFLGRFINTTIVKFWPFTALALTNFIIARPRIAKRKASSSFSVAVVIPTRNEAGNIDRIFKTIPQMGERTELIFVEGNSTDNTYGAIQEAIQRYPSRECKLFKQEGKGKGDAVRLGFSKTTADILMVFDADLTVPPQDLPRFYHAIALGKGEFINGVRLVYPLEKQAMQLLNMIANKLFGILFSWLLGQAMRDTLCGTKVLWRSDYETIAKNLSYFGDFDPFGDFDLLFGAAKLNLKIIEIPIRYKERTYGTTNISRWRHGVLLFRMVAFALNKIKFV